MKNIFLLFILTSFVNLYSQQVTLEELNIIAQNLAEERFSKPVHFEEIIETHHSQEMNIPLMYIVSGENGFVILSSHKSTQPVIGWSEMNAWTKEDIPPALQMNLDFYAKKIEFAYQNSVSPRSEVIKQWNHYLNENFTKQPYQEIGPLINTQWNQGCYYNSFFPTEPQGPCDHLYTGCVATAMGQVMKYWSFPQHGFESHSYSAGDYGTVSADFENTYYQWQNMPNSLTEENDAIAELLYHTAISVNSQFFPNGTGAFDHHIPYALETYFGYEENAEFVYRDNYQGNWTQLLKNELDLYRPIIYGGVEESTNYGHTFICDGYQEDDYFHINWGWGGAYDGYFTLDNLVLESYHWDTEHDAIIGIYPEGMSIQKNEVDFLYKIWPNPATSVIYFHLGPNKKVTYNLCNLNGQVIVKNTITETNSIDVSSLAEGIYILRIIDHLKTYTYKISVIH